MNTLTQETLGNVARLAEQMSYTASHGHVETLKAQADTLRRMIARLDMITECVRKDALNGKFV